MINNINWKLAVVCPVVALVTSCVKHTNVIDAKKDSVKLWIVKDVITGERRYFDYNDVKNVSSVPFEFFRVGDTVSFRVGFLYNDTYLYCQSPMIDSRCFEVYYNKKELNYRRDSVRRSEKIAKLTERFNNQR